MKINFSWKILLGAAVIALFAYSAYLALNSKAPAQPPADKINLSTPGGNTIPANDFTKNPVKNGGGAIEFKEANNFNIVYYSQNQYFIITLTAEPLQKAREDAEAEFLGALGISQQEACQLNVWLGVPIDVDQNLAGQNWGLSFCPNAKPLATSNH